MDPELLIDPTHDPDDQSTRKISSEEINLLVKDHLTEPEQKKPEKLFPFLMVSISVVFIIVVFILVKIYNSASISSAGGMTHPDISKVLPLDYNNNSSDSINLQIAKKTEFDNMIESGEVSLRIGAFSKAIEIFDRALRMNISNEKVRNKIDSAKILWVESELKRADNYLKDNDFDSALKIYNYADSIGPLRIKIEEGRKNLLNSRTRFEAGRNEQLMRSRGEERLRELGIRMVKITGLSAVYYIGTTEVTQRLWKSVMGYNPSYAQGDDLPVERVKWKEVQVFFTRLNKETNLNLRLPASGEWEYAASGGQTRLNYSGSNRLSEVGWYEVNSDGKTHPVMQLHPNNFGLYDMSGNVWEWCYDHSIKGGSWMSTNSQCRILSTGKSNDQGDYATGFRICRSSD